MSNVQRLLPLRPLFAFLLTILCVCAGVAQSATPGQAPGSAAPAPGTAPSTGAAPTITSPAPGPGQPVAFSHKTHVNVGKMACNDCHEPSRNGATLAMPQPPKCMLCHAAIATDKPDIQRIAAAAKAEQNLQWVRVYRVPSFVTFSHKTHTSAGAQCQDCHGPVAERDVITLEKDLSMGGCISCHQAKGAPTQCDTCHETQARIREAAPADNRVLAMLRRMPSNQAAAAHTVAISPVHRFLGTLAMPNLATAFLH